MNTRDTAGLSLYSAAQVRKLDRVAIEGAGIPGYRLMTRAGEAAWDVLQARWPDARCVQVLCGSGNNGGDGFVVARLALEAGWQVRVIQLGDADRISGDALTAREAFVEAGGTIEGFTATMQLEADVLVDALLGTGLERPLEADWEAAVRLVNRSGIDVIAMDIPTGLNADSGAVMGVAVRAAHTVTFIGRKQGLFTGQAPAYTGTVNFASLDVPDTVFEKVTPTARLYTTPQLDALAVPRERTAHKGDFGHLLIIGGDSGMAGAVRLAGEAALRAGAGRVSVATRKAHAGVLVSGCPELMVHGVEAVGELKELLETATAVVIGPGLGQSAWAKTLLAATLESPLPLVVDADALNLLACEPVKNRRWILTPHPGEAARLLQTDSQQVQADRFAAARELCERYDGTVVLKGAGTLVQISGQPVAVISAGNPGMATAGMGDVLSGVIGALLAQGLSSAQAAVSGASIHAGAGDRAAQQGERGLIARDVIAELRSVMNP